MKIGKRNTNNTEASAAFTSGRPSRNKSKSTLVIVGMVLVAAALIVWVYTMGEKATQTVDVIMTTQNIYKNQQITEEMLQPYSMIKAEFEKYSIMDQSGNQKRRLLTWDERGMIIGAFAAYPLQANTTPDYRCFYKSRVDNSDSVLYSYPGKEIVALDVAETDLNTFKTFLRPGDHVTITAVYTEDEKVNVTDDFGVTTTEKVTTYRSEIVFQDILIADLINNAGDSILDIYEDYNSRDVVSQAMMDANTTFQESVEPKSLLVALTPEEKENYYYYLSKSAITFRMSLPQRVE